MRIADLDDPVEQSVVDRFEQQVRLHADRRAVKTECVDLTYRELNRLANRVAHAILSRRPPDAASRVASGSEFIEDSSEPVVVLIGQSVEAIAAALGVLKAGKVYVPVDPDDSRVRTRQILADISPSVLITNHDSHSLASQLAPAGCDAINVDAIGAGCPDENPVLSISSNALAYVIYTSGSTGQPKGVMHTHRSLLYDTMSKAKLFGIRPEDQCSLLSSATGQGIKNMMLALLNGASLYPKSVRQEGLVHLPSWLIHNRITLLTASPPLFRSFLDLLTGAEEFPDLRLIRLGADRVYPDDIRRFQRHFADHCVLLNVLSTTETGSICASTFDKSSRIEGSTVPVGYPLDGNRVLLIEEETNIVSPSGSGVIAVINPHLSCGYWRRPELTRQAFRGGPDSGEERLFRSGDLGRWRPDGALEHLGRCDFQVKIRGSLVDTAEVEATLVAHEKVRSAVVHAWEGQPADPRLIAYIVPETNPPVTVRELRQYLAERLADHMLPSAFVMLDSLPLLGGGKIDRKSLPAPVVDRNAREQEYVAPRTPIEARLSAIWNDVLCQNRIGIFDNFFALGGHSLLATKIASRIVREFQVNLPLRTLFEMPTIEGQAFIILQMQARVAGRQKVEELLEELESASDIQPQETLPVGRAQPLPNEDPA